jgi:AbrB family looped-hinge helix DNA binding protein
MSNITNREKYNKMNTIFWERSKVDKKGRVLIPKAIRQKLSLNGNSEILWIEIKQKPGKSNEFTIDLGVDNK